MPLPLPIGRFAMKLKDFGSRNIGKQESQQHQEWLRCYREYREMRNSSVLQAWFHLFHKTAFQMHFFHLPEFRVVVTNLAAGHSQRNPMRVEWITFRNHGGSGFFERHM